MAALKLKTRAALLLIISIGMMACAHTPETSTPNGAGRPDGRHEGFIGFYTGTLNHLEGVRRGSCPMHPSCSQYSRQAMDRYGWLKGWVMTMDRLMRCGRDELNSAPRVFANGAWRYYDPVELNQWPAN